MNTVKQNKDEILRRYSSGKYSWYDYLKVKDWVSSIHEQPEVSQFLKTEWNKKNAEKNDNKKSLIHILNKIEHQILLEEIQKNKKARWLNLLSKAAAILFIPLLIFAVWSYFLHPSIQSKVAWAEIHSPEGARTQFSLPDGSTGWLNSGSILKYDPTFSNERVVELTGEAFFDVVHDNSTFKVRSGKTDITVLGTQFNVMAYSNINFTEIVLERGRIQVNGTEKTFSRILNPGQKLKFFPEENKIQIHKVDTKSYTAWKDGFLILDNETLEQASNRIERWYNVEIKIQDETLKNYRFKATFQGEPLEEVLRLMAISTPIKYTIEKRMTDPNNLYIKKKVTLELKK